MKLYRYIKGTIIEDILGIIALPFIGALCFLKEAGQDKK